MPAIRHNPHAHRTAIGSATPYPSLAELRARSDTSSPDDSFKDFCIKDYVIAIKRISRRKLHEIDIDNYQRSLLMRGVNPWDDEEPYDDRVDACMGYAGAVGTMLLDEMAGMNGRRVEDVKKLTSRLEATEWENRKLKASLAAARVDIGLLREREDGFERLFLEIEERLETSERVYDCLRQFHTMGILLHRRMIRLEDSYTNFRLSQEHGRGNPIVVEDDDSDSGRSQSPLMVRVERQDTVIPQGDGPWMIEIDD